MCQKIFFVDYVFFFYLIMFLHLGSVTLVKKACYILLRFLELPPNDSFNRLASPKKLPHIPYRKFKIFLIDI